MDIIKQLWMYCLLIKLTKCLCLVRMFVFYDSVFHVLWISTEFKTRICLTCSLLCHQIIFCIFTYSIFTYYIREYFIRIQKFELFEVDSFTFEQPLFLYLRLSRLLIFSNKFLRNWFRPNSHKSICMRISSFS